MKFIGGFIFLLGCFINAKCTHFEIHSKTIGGACILLDIDATFNLTYTNGHKTQDAPLFNLSGATVDNSSSKCGNEIVGTTSVLSARIFPSGELLMFRFERKNGAVVMSVRFTLDAKKHFRNMNETTPIELKDEKHLPTGPDTPNSYKCVTEEMVKFRPNNNFMMIMKIRNLHVQAYRITRSTYGPVVECSQDTATSTPMPETTVVPHNETTTPYQPETTTEIQPNTTTEPEPETTTTIQPNTTTEPQPETTTPVQPNTTTEPEPETTTPKQPNITTEPYSNVTTEPLPETTTQPEPETTTKPQPETTTAPEIETTTTMIPTTPFPHGSKYVVRDNEEVCIILQGRITFDIPFQKKDGSTGTATVSVPDSVNVNGNCSYSDTEQEITLTFFKSQWMLDIVIAKESKSVLQNFAIFKALSKSSDYSWQAVTLTYVVDSHFPNAKNQGMKVKAVADGTFGKFKANTDGSYMCNAEQDIEFGKDKKMKMDYNFPFP
ncbi:uncharacterized protein LOC123555154 [Mercenaria mercenaria]|uniref:uncharacterized protein LOC123555154 n=1 Tax=Mercenaria mercenaria TaxID=6596 RepID=UPI00234E595F|nr:uncharacterized protein LOC123555154 [Mercenaria mercenaria]